MAQKAIPLPIWLTTGQIVEIVGCSRVRICAQILAAGSLGDMDVDLPKSLRHIIGVSPIFDVADGGGFLAWGPKLPRITEGEDVSIRILSCASDFTSCHTYRKGYWKGTGRPQVFAMVSNT